MVTTSVRRAQDAFDGATEHRAIDVHTHVVPESLPQYLGAKAPSLWPSIVPAHACHRHLMIDNAIFRTLSDQCWSARRRVQDMDTMRIGQQVLSPMPELLCLAESITKTLAICMRCGNPAKHTQRLVESTELIVVGAAGSYEARCRRCFEPGVPKQEYLDFARPQRASTES